MNSLLLCIKIKQENQIIDMSAENEVKNKAQIKQILLNNREVWCSKVNFVPSWVATNKAVTSERVRVKKEKRKFINQPNFNFKV